MFTVSVIINMEKYKEQESIEILKSLDLINDIEEYQKIYNHVLKHKPRMYTEKCIWKIKLFNWRNKSK